MSGLHNALSNTLESQYTYLIQYNGSRYVLFLIMSPDCT